MSCTIACADHRTAVPHIWANKRPTSLKVAFGASFGTSSIYIEVYLDFYFRTYHLISPTLQASLCRIQSYSSSCFQDRPLIFPSTSFTELALSCFCDVVSNSLQSQRSALQSGQRLGMNSCTQNILAAKCSALSSSRLLPYLIGCIPVTPYTDKPLYRTIAGFQKISLFLHLTPLRNLITVAFPLLQNFYLRSPRIWYKGIIII
jgi:hypothetical protein